MRFTALAIAFLLAVGGSGAAKAANCRPPCSNGTASIKPSSVIPPDDEFVLRGDLFSENFTRLSLGENGSQEVGLRVGFQIGTTTYNSIFVSENGFVSFGSALPNGSSFQSISNFSQLGAPVISPFYADLVANQNSRNSLVSNNPPSFLGDVVVQYGLADPNADGGAYNRDDLQSAVRITWYGLTLNQVAMVGQSGLESERIFAQLLIAGDGAGTNSFEFRYGPPDMPGQDGDGILAGFSLGRDAYQFSGPFLGRIPTYFEFNDGRFVGALAGGVPEPQSWLMMIFGFLIIGSALRAQNQKTQSFCATCS